MTSSVRLTTALGRCSRFRNVVVSRNGFKTILSSSHSTPMGAKLILPRSSRVVTIVSTITGPARLAAEQRQACWFPLEGQPWLHRPPEARHEAWRALHE